MSVFRCSKCGCVENTAVSNYWEQKFPFGGGESKPLLCSQCDPEIGKWHGRFPRNTPEDLGLVEGPDGFLYDPDDNYYKRLLKEKGKP